MVSAQQPTRRQRIIISLIAVTWGVFGGLIVWWTSHLSWAVCVLTIFLYLLASIGISRLLGKVQNLYRR